MPVLTVDLQEGFVDDHVTVLVDDRAVFDRRGVRTRYEIGFAARAEIELDRGAHKVCILLPDKGEVAETTVDTQSVSHVGVERAEGQVIMRPSAEPFRYM